MPVDMISFKLAMPIRYLQYFLRGCIIWVAVYSMKTIASWRFVLLLRCQTNYQFWDWCLKLLHFKRSVTQCTPLEIERNEIRCLPRKMPKLMAKWETQGEIPFANQKRVNFFFSTIISATLDSHAILLSSQAATNHYDSTYFHSHPIHLVRIISMLMCRFYTRITFTWRRCEFQTASNKTFCIMHTPESARRVRKKRRVRERERHVNIRWRRNKSFVHTKQS